MSKKPHHHKTPKAGVGERLKFLFSGRSEAGVREVHAHEPAARAAEKLTPSESAARILNAMNYSNPPDMDMVRHAVACTPDILKSPYIVTAMSVGGRHPEMPWLCYAASADQDGVLVRFMIENGAPLDARDTLYKGTPLFWAAMKGNKAAAEILLEAAGGIEDRNNGLGKKPAETAAHFDHSELAAWLKSREPMVPRIPDLLRPPKNRVIVKD